MKRHDKMKTDHKALFDFYKQLIKKLTTDRQKLTKERDSFLQDKKDLEGKLK